MASERKIDLIADRKGAIWDLLLYVPTVVALASIGLSFWFNGDHNIAYVLYFLTCFFFIIGVNRIFKTRLMLFPAAPISIELQAQSVILGLRNGELVNLIKAIKYYSDYSGKTFGLSGMDGAGKLVQFVFHKGQFFDASDFDTVCAALKKQFG